MGRPPTTTDRIGLAWRELRRGASGVSLRSYLYGGDGPQLDQAQIDALEILVGASEGLSMSEFADAMHVDPSTATRAVDRLQKLGMAERLQADDDRRFVHARATTDGKAMVRRIRRMRAIGMERILEPFEEHEREEFARYLERFVESIERLVDELAEEAVRR